jgi:hypothetical protein
MVQVWADLHPSDHLLRALQEEQRRKVRAEERRLTHGEDHPTHLEEPMSQKH